MTDSDTEYGNRIKYCPVCRSELDEEPGWETEGWAECPEHGRVHLEFYKP